MKKNYLWENRKKAAGICYFFAILICSFFVWNSNMKTIYAEEPTQSAVVSPALSPEPSQNVTAVPSDTPGAAETPTVTVSPTQKLYTLSFSNPNNEWTYNGKTTIPPIQRAEKKLWGSLPVPERAGYTFRCWYDKENVNNTFSPQNTKRAQKDVTLLAKWTPTTYEITYSLKGGSFVSGSPTYTYK